MAVLIGPDDDEVVVLSWTGYMVKAFLGMLNMNSVRDHEGLRVTFHLRQTTTGEWTIETRTHLDERTGTFDV